MEPILTLAPTKITTKCPTFDKKVQRTSQMQLGIIHQSTALGSSKVTRKWLQSTRRTLKTSQTRLQIPHPRFDSLHVRAESILTLAHLLLDIREAFTPLLNLRCHLGMTLFEFVEGVCGVGCARVTCAQGAQALENAWE
jgi:hypothetical protein